MKQKLIAWLRGVLVTILSSGNEAPQPSDAADLDRIAAQNGQ